MTTTSFSCSLYFSILLHFLGFGNPFYGSRPVKTESFMKLLDHIKGKFIAIGPLGQGP